MEKIILLLLHKVAVLEKMLHKVAGKGKEWSKEENRYIRITIHIQYGLIK